jgi:hypothetical protein
MGLKAIGPLTSFAALVIGWKAPTAASRGREVKKILFMFIFRGFL